MVRKVTDANLKINKISSNVRENRCQGGPCDLVSQTSETKSVAISLLKCLNGDPLNTAMTCLGPMVSHKALLAVMPRPPSHSHVTYAFMGILMLVLLVVGGTHPNSLK